MKILRTFLICVVAFTCNTALADDYTNLIIQYKDGVSSTENIPFADFSTFTFDNGKMNIVNNGTTVKTVDITSIQRIYLGSTSGINATVNEATIDNGCIYDLQGRKITVGGKSLPKGIYIQNGRKYVVR